jgi:hypothetical protein
VTGCKVEGCVAGVLISASAEGASEERRERWKARTA